MKKTLKYIIAFVGLSTVAAASAQSSENESFAIKIRADIGLGGAIGVNSVLPLLDAKTSSGNYGVEFGYTFWKKGAHRLEINAGVGYSPTSLTLDLGKTEYSYSAPSSADMDGNPYERYYEISALNQEINSGLITVPIHFTYAYRFSRRVGVYADLGVRLHVNMTSKINSVTGEAYSYGIFPEYDDLKIDENWLNDFGQTNLASAHRGKPEVSEVTPLIIAGIGTEIRIFGPLAANIGFQYNAGLTNLFKNHYKGGAFTALNAPVSYTVAEGQKVKSLTDYLSKSRLSYFSLNLGLVFRF